jgi:hypothetical protein
MPFLIPLIVQEVLELTIKQDLPPAMTLLPVIFEPPFFFGKLILTVTLTSPFLTEDDVTETIVGAEGLVMLAFA